MGVVGHTEQRKRLAYLWRKDKLPSALMFTGVSGIGKSLVAKELFRTIFCEKGEVYGGCGNENRGHSFFRLLIMYNCLYFTPFLY